VPIGSRSQRSFPARPLSLEAVERLFGLVPAFAAARSRAAALRATGLRLGRTSLFWDIPLFTGSGDPIEKLTIGDYCGFNCGCFFELDDRITIGDHVSVGHDVMFLTRTYATTDPHRRGTPSGSAPIEIGDGAWIGARCTLLPGTSVGAGSVIGAAAVIEGSIPPNVLVTGNRKISLARWR